MTAIQNIIPIELTSNQRRRLRRKDKLVPRRKLVFAEKLQSLLDEYDKCLIIEISNIGSNQIDEMRKRFRGKARFLFGKNTLIRKVIRDYIKKRGIKQNKKLMKLSDLIRGHCGLVFTKNEINPIRKELIRIKKQCSAKMGAIAPIDVFIPVGPTNLEPTKTSIFQSMDIETRIRGTQIDVISTKHLIKKGHKIGASEASLLSQLNIKPFWYGIKVKSIYENGEVIQDASFMDLSIDEIADSFYNGLHQIAAFCCSLPSYPTMINIPHSMLNAYRQTIGISIMLDSYSWDALDAIQNILEYAQFVQLEQNQTSDINISQTQNASDSDSDSDQFNPFQLDSSSDSEDQSSSSQD